MMLRALTIGAAVAPLALAAPTEIQKRQNIDVTVLQFALTLEHLENVFYKQALQNYSAQQFVDAGYGPNYYNTLKYIASDEESHTKFLSGALTQAGVAPVAACEYNFPSTDVKSFITLSTVLEGVGTSAYLGGAALITNKDYLTAAGAILVSEALHTSFQRNAIKAIPNANPYGTPLGPNAVFTLAAAFIKSCPQSNAALPFMPFPALSADNAGGFCEQPNCSPQSLPKRDAEAEADAAAWQDWHKPAYTTAAPYHPKPTPAPYHPQPTTAPYHPQPSPSPYPQKPNPSPDHPSAPSAGAYLSFTSAAQLPAGSFLTFVSGLTITSVPGNVNGNKIAANIPAGISGQTYVLVTKSKISGALADDQIVSGPAIIEVKPAPPSIDFGYRKE